MEEEIIICLIIIALGIPLIIMMPEESATSITGTVTQSNGKVTIIATEIPIVTTEKTNGTITAYGRIGEYKNKVYFYADKIQKAYNPENKN